MLLRRLSLFCVVSTLTVIPVFGVSAQGEPARDAAEAAPASQTAAESRATEFRAVSGGEEEDVPGVTLVFVAYVGILVLLFAYLFRQGRLLAAAERELAELRRDALGSGE